MEANEKLINFLNSSVKTFYRTYTAYLGGNFATLCQDINCKDPNVSLQRCVYSAQDAIRQDKRLAGIKGIYVLVDEYDSFPNNYLAQLITAEGPKIAWEETAVGHTFKSFWTSIKSLSINSIIKRVFITGISPLSLSSVDSGFNVARNLSFHGDLASLCGLTCSDLEEALDVVCDYPLDCSESLTEMTTCFNGYHFCMNDTVETVYNTETCLAYLQCRIERVRPETHDPPNSEVPEEFLTIFAASATAITDFEEAMKRDEEGNFMPFEYSRFKQEFTLRDLVC